MVRDTLVPLLLPRHSSFHATPPPPPSLVHLPLVKFVDFMERKLVKDSKQFLDEKTKNGLQGCLPIQTIHCAQTNCTLTDNDDRFSKKKKKKKEHVHNIAFQEKKQPFSL